MNHQLATKEQLPERYVFGDLSRTERDDFEEHLADCSRCMEEVKVAQSFSANTYAVFRDQAQAAAKDVAEKSDLFAWWGGRRVLAFSGGMNLIFAAAALYGFVGVIPLLKTEVRDLASPAISKTFVLQGNTRSARPVYQVSRDVAASFRLDLPEHFDHYVCSIENSTDRGRKTYNLPGAGNAETLDLTIPVAGLNPGDYVVKLSGVQGAGSESLVSFVLRVMPEASK